MLSECFFLWHYDNKWKVFNVDTLEQMNEFDTEAEALTWMKSQEVC